MKDFLWLDLETTGLNNKNCRIIEVGAQLSKEDLKPYAQWQALIYTNPNVGWEGVALEMHKKSGLFDLVQTYGKHEPDAILEFNEFLTEHLEHRKANLAGNSVHFDRSFLSEQWPSVMKFLTHRHLDVSSFKILAESRGVKKFLDGPPAHRAMADIDNSIKEFHYYTEELKKLI